MWGKILISLALLSLVNCHGAAITCNPNLANPGCPNNRTCDPTGICQLQCSGNEQCTDPGAPVCDESSNLTPYCQTDCTASGLCPSGQICFPYTINAPTGSGKSNLQLKTCKAECNQNNNNPCGANQTFECLQVGQGTQFICWGKPNS